MQQYMIYPVTSSVSGVTGPQKKDLTFRFDYPVDSHNVNFIIQNFSIDYSNNDDYNFGMMQIEVDSSSVSVNNNEDGGESVVTATLNLYLRDNNNDKRKFDANVQIMCVAAAKTYGDPIIEN